MSDNNKLIISLAESIKYHRELEIQNRHTNSAVGLANVNFSGQEMKLWLTNRENNSGIHIKEDFTGRTNIYQSSKDTLTTDGKPVYKNTKVGECLIRNNSGTHRIITPGGERDLKIFNTTFFTPDKHRPEALDIRMNINESKPRFFRSLQEILGEIRSSTDEIDLLEEQITFQNLEDNSELINRIEDLNRKRNEALAKAKTFIRRGYELRYQPILDPWQEEIKRSNIFNATIAINGGPGTGKTTSLIQRIKFLTDEEALKEYLPNLTREQHDKLFSAQNGWVFYTPGELLKLFLKNSMISEGLLADDNHVKIWNSEKELLLRKYKLVNSDTQRPFLIYRKKGTGNILPYDSRNLKMIIDSFDQYFLNYHNEKLNRIADFDCSQFIWKLEGESIKNYINRQQKDYSFDGLIRLYFNLQDQFTESLSKIVKLNFDLIRSALGSILSKINRNSKEGLEIYTLIERWLRESRSEDDEEEIDDISDDEDGDLASADIEYFLMQKIKSVLRKNGLKKYDKRSKLTENEEKLKSLIEKLGYSFENEDLNKIGQYSYFSKNFAKLTRGPVINLFIEIPFLYKKFRRSELSEQKNGWNYTILEDIVLKDDLVNRRLHSDEQAFLLTFINTLVQKCYKVSKIKSRNITHSYFQGYNDASHCVIGVDESTDFHLVDLLAMHSLTDYELSSVTYSGDIMQRLTKDGIRDWGELKTLIKKIEVKELLISYRQSPTLLEIASSIYNRASGKNAEYISCMDRDEMEPKPLFFKSNDEGEKIDWISKRILEIYNAYGNTIPSIAVFLSDESQLEFFADKLGETDRLADVGITVKACNKGQVLGDSNMVRVFSVEYIKGLEFEAVFYHNLDNLLELAQEDTTIKNLYVGLSRASFYMAITSSSDLKYFSYLEKYFNHNQQNWI